MATTSLEQVYEVFLQLVSSNDWNNEEYLDLYEEQWYTYFSLSRDSFLYPRVSLELDDNKIFVDQNITEREINLLALGMVWHWASAVANNTDITELGYTERDWKQSSAAAHLRQVSNFGVQKREEYIIARTNYSRSVDGKPNPIFGSLAGIQGKRGRR